MCEPFGLSAIFASVGSALKVADVAIRIAEVGSENDVFVRMIHNVRDSLTEVERLLSSDPVQTRVAQTPGKIPWIQRTISSSKSALNDIGRWVERARAEQQSTGSIQFTTRVRWIFNDHEKLISRTAELSNCHQQLSTVLNYLTPLESSPVEGLKPVPEYGANLDEIFSKHRRRTVSKVPITASMTPASSEPCVHFKHNPLGSYLCYDEPPAAVEHTSQDNNKPFDRGSIDESVYPTWCSFKEPPASPPPAYATVVESVVRTRQAHVDQKIRFGEAQSEKQDISRVKTSGKVQTEAQDTWAYRLPQIDRPVSELAGDTVDMSGTNSLGPVNPYEYSTILKPITAIGEAASPNIGNVAELLGDLALAAELPSHDPGSPPGYPSRSSNRALFYCPRKASPARVLMERQTRPVHELSATPSRRPLSLHTLSEPVRSSHDFQQAICLSELDARSLGRIPVISKHYYTMTSNEMYARPSSVFAAGLSSSPRTPLVSPDMANLPSQSTTQIDRPMALAEPQALLQHTPSASSARMQRQKQMMDFFDNIR